MKANLEKGIVATIRHAMMRHNAKDPWLPRAGRPEEPERTIQTAAAPR